MRTRIFSRFAGLSDQHSINFAARGQQYTEAWNKLPVHEKESVYNEFAPDYERYGLSP